MEKLLYIIYKPGEQSTEDFSHLLRGTVAGYILNRPGVHKLRISLADAAVEAACELCMQTSSEVPAALLSVWMDTCLARQPVEAELSDHGLRFHGYLVCESEPLPNLRHPAADGERVYGMNQVVLLQKPPRLDYVRWLELWQGGHTQVAIDTQSSFGYRQNLVVRPLTASAPPCDAIVEENFPPEAMTSQLAFYAAADEAALKANLDRMMASCASFIDFDRIDVVPMSEYVIRA